MKTWSISTAGANLFGERLAKRFFLVKQQGNQKYYFDLETGQTNLQPMHLMATLIEWGVNSPSDAMEIVRHQYLHPLVEKPLYRPGEPPIVVRNQLRHLNLWIEPDVLPDESIDPGPFIRHLGLVLGSDNKANYVLDMLAYRYQHLRPKHKPHIAFYFFGKQGGAGKSTFAETLTKVFGSSAVQTTNTARSLTRIGSVDLWSRTWLIVEEAQVSKGTSLYDSIKSYTGGDQTYVDKKFASVQLHETPAQLIMLSNRLPMFLEELDRRIFVSQWHFEQDDERLRALYFKQYREWLEGGGYSAIAGHLKARKVTIDPFEAAPMTPEKEQAIGFMVEPVVNEVVDYLQSNPSYRLFEVAHFENLFARFNVKQGQWKHVLSEAGLYKFGRVKIGDKQPVVWMRETDSYVSSRGHEPPKVVTNDGAVFGLEDAFHPALGY